MFVPELLYQLSERDQQVTWLDPVFVRVGPTVSAATQITETVYTVPSDRALCLQNFNVILDPGAAQTVRRANLAALPTTGTLQVVIRAEEWADAINEERVLHWAGSIIVPANWRLQTFSAYDAAAAGNSQDTTIIGVLIPIGNIQRV